jgi:hypothetical protein
MADITVTAAQVSLVDPLKAEVYSLIAAEAITAGQVVFIDNTGKAQLADADAAGEQQARGIALNAAGIGGAVDIVKRGRVAGFTLTDQNYSAPIYLSDTTGALADAAGATTVPVGIVMPLTDRDRTKVVYADFRWGADWA